MVLENMASEVNDPNSSFSNSELQSKKIIKIVLPHVAIVCLLFVYIAGGGVIYRTLESPAERAQILQKIANVRKIYAHIIERSFQHCTMDSSSISTFEEYNQFSLKALKQLTDAHYASAAPVNVEDVVSQLRVLGNSEENRLEIYPKLGEMLSQPRWSYASAILYALGVITTTGYSYVQVTTTLGQLFSIVFGMIGFPLLFITAADMGKCLSEIVFAFYCKYNVRQPRRLSHHTFGEQGLAVNQHQDESYSRRSSEFTASTGTTFELSSAFVFCCTFCVAIAGAVMYSLMEGWTFIDSVYYTFMAITNVTLVDNPVSSLTFAVVTVIYVVVGLAVVTMSIDLAESHIRSVFRKIHYYGRKIRRMTIRFRIDDDVKAVLKVMDAIRQSNPEKKHITHEDVVRYIHDEMCKLSTAVAFHTPRIVVNSDSKNPGSNENDDIKEDNEKDTSKPMKTGRSRSIAFTPDLLLSTLRFADEQGAESNVTTAENKDKKNHRQLSPAVSIGSGSKRMYFLPSPSTHFTIFSASSESIPNLEEPDAPEFVIFSTDTHRYKVEHGHVSMID